MQLFQRVDGVFSGEIEKSGRQGRNMRNRLIPFKPANYKASLLRCPGESEASSS
jgi:hypothetical protein